MNIFEALQQILDVPTTFKRPDLTYDQLMASIAAALTLLSASNTAQLDETSYDDASAGWIDVWGALGGIPRRTGEADDVFHARTPNMLLAWRDSVVAIRTWLKVVENLPNTQVVENLPRLGYTVTVPATLTPNRLKQILTDLAWVRPAGMPFNFVSATGGTYLTTVNYCSVATSALGTAPTPMDFVVAEDDGSPPTTPFLIEISGRDGVSKGRVTGAYLASTVKTAGFGPHAATDNQPSLLPDILLTDPTINPSLQGAVP
jgi:hypothetical protein